MFTGIITHIGKAQKITKNKNNCNIEIHSNMIVKKNEIGSSISCSGVCLTLEKSSKKLLKFYLSKETLDRTNFKSIKKNDLINLEKSLKFGDRMSGHFVQGHVDITSKVNKIRNFGKSWVIDFSLPNKYKKYVITKGSITINGVSLTINNIILNGFQISIVPHTLKLTNLINLKKDSLVNLEFDILGKYIRNFIK